MVTLLPSSLVSIMRLLTLLTPLLVVAMANSAALDKRAGGCTFECLCPASQRTLFCFMLSVSGKRVG